MSNILERHLEQNIEPKTSKQDYIDQAIQIFQDMKEEDITYYNVYKYGNKYCLNGLFSRMTGFKDNIGFCDDSADKIGWENKDQLTMIHLKYIDKKISFEQMRTEAIEYMRSLK